MISKESLSENWIKDIATKYKSDPILVEKVIRALYLLETLKQTSLKFVFKGGTALMLMLPKPKRFSIDIDIIVPEKSQDIASYLDQVITNSDFIAYKLQERSTNSKIEKAHYKFYYKPVANTRAESEYILLDILYENSHYGEYTHEIAVNSQFLLSEGEDIAVTVPLQEAILGDKLTAYAPNTTGVQYKRSKEVEIIKQLFDIGNLFDIVNDAKVISNVFERFAKTELKYRKLDLLPTDVLEDIYQTGIVIGTRGKSGVGRFDELQKGIQNIRNFIFSESFHLERAMVPAAKAAYIAAVIRTNEKKLKRYTDPKEITDWNIDQPFETKLNKLKKSNPEAFFYWCLTFKLMSRIVK